MRRFVVIAILGIACGKNGATPSAGSASATVALDATIEGSSGSSADPNGGPDSAKVEAELAALEQLKIKTCACADLPCVEKVGLEHQAWKAKAKSALAGVKSTKAQEERGNRLDDEMKACYRWVEAGLGSGAGGSEANAKIEIALVELERFRNALCACTDAACADQVTADKKAWEVTMRQKMGTAKPDDKQKQRGQLYEDGFQECRKRIAAGGGESRFDTAIAELKGLKTKMCACANKTCGAKVEEEYKAWKAALAAEMKGKKPTADQQGRGDKVLAELTACRTKLK
jgi:hypothetical protein